MKFTELSDTEIFIRLSRFALERGVEMTVGQKSFYVSFLHYAEKAGKYDVESGRYYVQMSVQDIKSIFEISSNNMIETAFKQLCAAGVIEREKNLQFKKYGNCVYRKNMPSRTFLNLEYLKEDND